MNIFVGNLSGETTADDLRATFSEYGYVKHSAVIKDRETGQSRGFGFVEMPDNDEAKAAMEALNGADLGGRDLLVNEARPREERSGGFQRRDGGDRPRRDFGDRPRRDFGDRPPRRDFGDRPPRREFGDRPPRRDFGDRPPRRDNSSRPPRHWDNDEE